MIGAWKPFRSELREKCLRVVTFLGEDVSIVRARRENARVQHAKTPDQGGLSAIDRVDDELRPESDWSI
jgi:hypothetical protein